MVINVVVDVHHKSHHQAIELLTVDVHSGVKCKRPFKFVLKRCALDLMIIYSIATGDRFWICGGNALQCTSFNRTKSMNVNLHRSFTSFHGWMAFVAYSNMFCSIINQETFDWSRRKPFKIRTRFYGMFGVY